MAHDPHERRPVGPPEPRSGQEREPEPGRSKVLIVRLGAIGDVTNALTLAQALRGLREPPFTGWVVHDLARPLVEGHPAVDRVHLWRRGSGIAGLAALVRELRAVRYDVAVDLQRLAKSALVARLSGAPRVVGYDRRRTKERSWLLTNERIAPGDPGAHMLEQYLEVARHLGAKDAGPARALPPDAGAAAWADGRLAALGGAPIVVNLGASKPANRWPPERFGELAARCAAAFGGPVVLTGGPGDVEAGRIAVCAAEGAPGVASLVGETDLRQLVALCARARLFVGCDTGPMHLAAAVEAPVVALFGPADARRTGPYGGGHRVVRATPEPSCAPCGRKRCNQARHACMEDITVDAVLAACRATLAAPCSVR